jgi:hypothetical protein
MTGGMKRFPAQSLEFQEYSNGRLGQASGRADIGRLHFWNYAARGVELESSAREVDREHLPTPQFLPPSKLPNVDKISLRSYVRSPASREACIESRSKPPANL